MRQIPFGGRMNDPDPLPLTDSKSFRQSELRRSIKIYFDKLFHFHVHMSILFVSGPYNRVP